MSSPSVSGAEEQDLTHGDPWELQNTLNLVIKISILSMKTKVFEMRVEVRNDDGFEAFWKITRKEAEFRNLHEKLAIRHKKVRIPRFPGSSLTQKLGSAEKKQKQFQQYLDELSEIPELARSDEMSAFLIGNFVDMLQHTTGIDSQGLVATISAEEKKEMILLQQEILKLQAQVERFQAVRPVETKADEGIDVFEQLEEALEMIKEYKQKLSRAEKRVVELEGTVNKLYSKAQKLQSEKLILAEEIVRLRDLNEQGDTPRSDEEIRSMGQESMAGNE